MPKDSDAAVQVTNARIEAALADSPAFTRVEPHFYVVRQGTAYVYLHVLPWAPDRALVRLVAQLSCVVIVHTLLGGETLDADELLVALRDLSVLADEYDDRIVEEAGGQRMQDLIDASATAAVFTDLEAPRAWDKG